MNSNFLKMLAASRRWLRPVGIILLSMGMGGALGFGLCSLLPQWYGYTALIEPADLGPIADKMMASSTPKFSFTQTLSPAEIIRGNSIAYLKFKYLEKRREPSSRKPYLLDVDEARNSECLEITAAGLTVNDAKLFLNSVLKDLSDQYEPKVRDIRDEALQRKQALEQRYNEYNTLAQKSEQMLIKLGFSSAIQEKIIDFQRSMMDLLTEIEQLENMTSPRVLHNFNVLYARPVDEEIPIRPHTILITIICALFGGSLSFGVLRFLSLKDDTAITLSEEFDKCA